jgi:flotillin
MVIALFFFIGLGLIAAGIMAPGVQGAASLTLIIAGGVVLIGVSIMTVITRLYRRASANMAFVRTGMGGAKKIKDGGCVVIPVVHQVIPVSLETMRLNVERKGPHA